MQHMQPGATVEQLESVDCVMRTMNSIDFTATVMTKVCLSKIRWNLEPNFRGAALEDTVKALLC